MESPLSQKELLARQNPKPMPCMQLSHSKSDIVSSQQPSIIWVIAYLTPSDVICCEILKYSQVYEPYRSIV